MFFLIMGWAPEVGRDANEVRETTVSIVVSTLAPVTTVKTARGQGRGGWWVVGSDAGGTLSTSARACDARI